MLTISKNRFLQRLDILPQPIRDIAFSLEAGGVLQSIAEAHHLDRERTKGLLTHAGAVFFGFVHRTDFAKELGENLKLDPKIAVSIAEETERKVFSRISKELDEFYQPTAGTEEPQESMEARLTAPLPNPEDAFFIKIRNRLPATVGTPTTTTKDDASPSAPFVLHEEKSVGEGVKKDSMKGFSLPFGLFKQKQGELAPTPRATVEAPSFAKATAGKPTKEEEKVVHYSEYRTNLAPGAGGEFINLETFGKTPATPPVKTPITAPPTTTAPTSEATLQIKKTQAAPLPARTQPVPTRNGNSPKVEGNTVDLR